MWSQSQRGSHRRKDEGKDDDSTSTADIKDPENYAKIFSPKGRILGKHNYVEEKFWGVRK